MPGTLILNSMIESTDFTVELREEGGVWRRQPAELLLTGDGTGHKPFPPAMLAEFGGIAVGTRMARASLCEFFWTSPVEVRVCAPGFDGPLSLSARKDLPVRRDEDGALVFRLDEPEMCLVRKGDDYLKGLSLWARPEPASVSGDGFRHVLRFEPGFHDAESDARIRRDAYDAPVIEIAEDDTLVVIEKGAAVEASLDIRGARHVTVCGGGRIDLSRRLPHYAGGFAEPVLWGPFRTGALPAIYVHAGAEDVTVRDLVAVCDFRGVCLRNAARVAIRDCGLFTSTVNADGVNMVSSQDVACDALYIRSQDDCWCAYNNCDSIPWLWDEGFPPRSMCRAALRRSFIGSNARAIVIGGHGQSGTRGAPNEVRDVEVSDCRILGNLKPCDKPGVSPEHLAYWSGIFRILSQSDEWVHDLRFLRNVVEWVPGYRGSAHHLCVRSADQVSYAEKTGGWKIEDVLFEGNEWRAVPPPGAHTPDVMQSPPDDGTGLGLRRIRFA